MPPWRRRALLRLVLSLVAGAVALWLLARGALPLVPSKQALAAVPWWASGGYLLAYASVHWLRAVRWRWLLAPLGEVSLGRLTRVSFIGFAAIVILPLRAGELVRPLLIRKETSISGWGATGTIAAERVIDGLMVSALLALGLLFATQRSPLPTQIGELKVPVSLIPVGAYLMLALFACAMLAMVLFYARRQLARRLVNLLVGWASPRLGRWISARVEQLALGLGFLPKGRYAVPFTLVTLLYWLGNAAATQLLAVGCGLTGMDFFIALVSMGVLALGILMPNAPGYFGAFQISVYASLALFFPLEQVTSEGAAFVFLQYVVQTGVTLLAALGAWLTGHSPDAPRQTPCPPSPSAENLPTEDVGR